MATSNVGLEVVLGVAAGASGFREPSKRNIGLLMERERGVPDKVYKIASLEDDQKVFGAPVANSFGGWVVKSIFDNVGNAPATIYGSRLIASSSVAATNSSTFRTVTITATAAYQGSNDPGTWGNSLSYKLYTYDFKNRNLFTLEIYYKNKLVESFTGATCASLQATVNAQSGYMKITFSAEIGTTYDNLAGTVTVSLAGTTVTGTGTAFLTAVVSGDLLYNAAGTLVGRVKSVQSDTSLTLVGGAAVAITGAAAKVRADEVVANNLSSGTYVAPVEADFYGIADSVAPVGLALFDGIDVQIVAVTENHTLTMLQKGIEYVRTREDAIFIGQLPLNANEQVVESYANALQESDIVPAAGYIDWVEVLNESGDLITIPGLGVYLGAGFIRTPFLQGDYIHIPPAGVDSAYKNVQSVAVGQLSQAQVNKYVKEYTVNVSQYNSNYGRYLISSRTFSTNPLWQSIHIVLQAFYYRRVLLENMLFIVQKPNSPELKKDAVSRLITYFEKEYEKGALERSIPFNEACKVVSDQTNNPAGQDRKQLNILIEYIPTEAVESVKISLNRNDQLLTAKIS